MKRVQGFADFLPVAMAVFRRYLCGKYSQWRNKKIVRNTVTVK